MALGSATLTSAGRLPFSGVIHVAEINGFWRATAYFICESVRAALKIVSYEKFKSVAFPAIGAGADEFSEADSIAIMTLALSQISTDTQIMIVQYNSTPFNRV
jgi:O-acetyl-ADP-ribose deacetylase